MNKKVEGLQERIKFYERILNNVEAGIWINYTNRNLYLNKKSRDTLGQTTESLNEYGLEKYNKDTLHPDDINTFEDSIKEVLYGNKESLTAIFRQKDKTGKYARILVSGGLCKWMNDDYPIVGISSGIILNDDTSNNLNLDELIKENILLKSKIKLKSLTKREIEIVKSITKGLSTKEIAEEKNISFYTVETHRKNILQKLELKNTADLTRFATECGLY